MSVRLESITFGTRTPCFSKVAPSMALCRAPPAGLGFEPLFRAKICGKLSAVALPRLIGVNLRQTSVRSRTVFSFAASHEESKGSDIGVEKENEDSKVQPQGSEEAWQQALASFLQSIAIGCIYSETKNYPREPAAYVAIRTVRRFLEKQKDKVHAVIFCTTTSSDTDIYKRLLPLYLPRDTKEEVIARAKLPADVGDENGETLMDERKIRITPLPNLTKKKSGPRIPEISNVVPVRDVGLPRMLVLHSTFPTPLSEASASKCRHKLYVYLFMHCFS